MTARTRRAPLVAALAAVSALALGACSSSSEIESAAAAEEGGTALAVDTSPDQDRVRTEPRDEAIQRSETNPPGLAAG